MDEMITLAHGSGGRLYHQLVEELFLPAFGNPMLEPLTDAAVCAAPTAAIALTTDSFVVRPRFFPGGDIGRLAVCGTVNDLAMSGARPRYLTLGMILEAGLPLAELRRIVESIRLAAREAAVQIVSGDTKVVERGGCDGIYINTAGVGLFERAPLRGLPRPGDALLVSGNLGEHGLAVLAAREQLDFQPPLMSDVAPLQDLAAVLLEAAPQTSCLRDPTRGGLAATLNEWAAASGCGISLEEEALPIPRPVAAAAQLLGLDPLQIANEGKLVAAVPEQQAEAALQALRAHPLGCNAACVGRVGAAVEQPLVILRTLYGGQRIVDMPTGELLPRIC